MNKQIHRYDEINPKIVHAVDTIVDPIRQTISPKGNNVLFVGNDGRTRSTNDGKTIADSISVKDPVEDAIIDLIKQACAKTNAEAGDGTSTTAILSGIAIKEALKLIEAGMNPMTVKRALAQIGQDLVGQLRKNSIKVKGQKDIFNIAKISANSDEEIANNVTLTIKTVGLDGMVFIEPNNKPQTDIVEDTGFSIEGGMLSPEFRNVPDKFIAQYQNVPVLITDKRLYYQEEAETIIRTVLAAGYKSVVIVARDFIGQAVPSFIANHQQGKCNILLVKDRRTTESDSESLVDLATYLGSKIVSDKNGTLVNKLDIGQFAFAEKVYSDAGKTIITSAVKKNKALTSRVKALKSELSKDKENNSLKKRIASLTNGMVTIRVGAATGVELNEKVYRYEDAINAVRAAMRDGYLVGGGISLFNCFKHSNYDPEFALMMKKYTQANVRQIAINCGEHPESVVRKILDAQGSENNKMIGYNALNGEIEDLLTAGVVDPFKVTEMAVMNSMSVAGEIISSNFLIVPDVEDEE